MAKICKVLGVLICCGAIYILINCINESELYLMDEQFTVMTLSLVGTIFFVGVLIFVIGATKEETKKILEYVKENNDAILKTKWLIEKQYKEMQNTEHEEKSKIKTDNDADDIRRCEKCGASISTEAKFCVACGAETQL